MINKRIIVSGASGYVGRFIADGLLTAGYLVHILGRAKPDEKFFKAPVTFTPMSLSQTEYDPEIFRNCYGLVHASFHHVPGRYRGGEGDNSEEFVRFNHNGSMALFEAAKSAGIRRVLFLSSRAVYGSQATNKRLFETTEPNPDTLYGSVKLQTEQELFKLSDSQFTPIILRATGVYGPAKCPSQHKWCGLFEDFSSNKQIAPRVGTEVHGDDVSQAVNLLLGADVNTIIAATKGEEAPKFNISDILLDRYELLKTYARLTNRKSGNYPERAKEAIHYNVMDCTRLTSLGWRPRGYLDLSQIV